MASTASLLLWAGGEGRPRRGAGHTACCRCPLCQGLWVTQTHRPQASSFWFSRTEMGPGCLRLSSAVPAARQKRSLLARHAGFQEPQRRIGSLVTSSVFCAVCERRVSVCSSIALNRVSASFKEPGLQSFRGDPFGPCGIEELISTCSRGRPLSLDWLPDVHMAGPGSFPPMRVLLTCTWGHPETKDLCHGGGLVAGWWWAWLSRSSVTE